MRKVGFKVLGGGPKKLLGPLKIPFLKVNEGRSELNQPVIELPVPALGLAPKVFQDLVRLKEFFFLEETEIIEITGVKN